MKKTISILLIISLVLLIGCSNSAVQNATEPNTVVAEKTNERINAVKVLPNGNYVVFKEKDIVDATKFNSMDIIDAKTNEVINNIDISKYDSNILAYGFLNDYFYIYDYNIYVYDFSGNLVDKITLPNDILSGFNITDTVFALSNDLSKLAYISINDVDDESVNNLKLVNLESHETDTIYNLTYDSFKSNVPCGINSMAFSKDDKFIMFLGNVWPKQHFEGMEAKRCYGSINMQDYTVSNTLCEKTQCFYYGNTQYIYDASVAYKQTNTGVIITNNPSENKVNSITLKNKNESQCLCPADMENKFIAILEDYTNFVLTVHIYEDGKLIGEKIIKCKDEAEYNAIDYGNMCYSSKSNLIYYIKIIFDNDKYMGYELIVEEIDKI